MPGEVINPGSPGALTSPLTSEGDLMYQTSGTATRLPVGPSGSVLSSNGTDPAWLGSTVNAQTGTTYTFVAGDANAVVVSQNAAPVTFTLPSNASVPFTAPTTLLSVQQGLGAVTVSAATGVQLLYQSNYVTSVTTAAQFGTIAVTQIATNAWVAVTSTAPATVNPGVNPATISGLVGWYAADQLNLLTGATVSSWPDLSSNGNTLTATGTARPTFTTGGQNGRPVVTFNGSSNVMAAASPVSNGVQAIVVSKYASSTFASFAGLVTGTTNGTFDAYFTGQNATSRWDYADLGSGTGVVYYLDGNSLANTAATGPMAAAGICDAYYPAHATSSTTQVGLDRNNGARWWNGYVCEIVIYNVQLTTLQRENVERWLQYRWGTPTLPF